MKITNIIKGMDISTLIEEEMCGAKYYDDGKEAELIDILGKYNVNSIRLRLWNDPYSSAEDGHRKYGAGTNDLATVLELARRAKQHGMSVLLDFQYSDFWADPGKQYPPKAWQGMDAKELTGAVYEYTAEVLRAFKAENMAPYMVQVGNELTNGCCWPLGNRDYGHENINYEKLSENGWHGTASTPYFNPILKDIINAGIRAVREISPESIVMLHLDNGGNNALYRSWFDGYLAYDDAEDFDVIGMSYYPFWHGNFEALEKNVNDIAVRYGKEIVIAEVSMGHTMQDYRKYEKPESIDDLKGMATRKELIANLDYPMTIEGQADFMRHLNRIIGNVPNGLGRGYYYWEPAWVPVPGCGWATEASLQYIHDKGPCGNEWANQALFDYDGNALPALKI